ncbi:hypothetical protein ASPCAL13502 [Aspergillus calidoustus]|uniref:Short chain oxidoreductase n=1 Tax=Aspergillus calidoustus TaxID=454130 RepID=A0A0U5GGV9_ASPCI|nr:hypothetical protein ASPCAL13502 [Aspergillus calidoustus]
MATYLITGASRGLGFSLAAALASEPVSVAGLVFLTSRTTNTPQIAELVKRSKGRVVPVQLDPNEPESLRAAVEFVENRVQGRGLDVLVNNAGMMRFTGGKVGELSATDLTEVFHTNVTLTQLVTSSFLPLVRQGSRKIIANISSTVGSITLGPAFSMNSAYAYKISKAAMNMLTMQYAVDYKSEGFTAFAISPGWLKTDLGGPYADLPVEVGTKEVLRYLKEAGPEFNGRFLNIHAPGWEDAPRSNRYDGKDAPW